MIRITLMLATKGSASVRSEHPKAPLERLFLNGFFSPLASAMR